MKTNTYRLLLSLVASTGVACATANETPQPDPVQPVAEIGLIDTAILDTTSDTTADTSVVDAMPEAGRCVYPATETKACGACGTQSRFCLLEGIWTGFTACAGEKVDPECSIGQKQTTDCGNCGKQTDTCDEKTCTWTIGLCAGEGPCADGDEEAIGASCSVAGEVRKRTCDSKCKWSEYSECELQRGWLTMSAAPIAVRQRHTAVWTGTKMLVWGGYASTASPTYAPDGASYDPLSDKWAKLADSPLAGRRDHAAVWTGSGMIVWGGRTSSSAMADGAIYDPSTARWTTMATSPLSARLGVVGVWSSATKEFIVWGGSTDTSYDGVAANGAAYKPETDSWTLLPPAPIAGRSEPAFAMINGELVIFGGRNASDAGLSDGARFDPVMRTWIKFSPPPSAWVTRMDPSYASSGDSLGLYGGRTSTGISTYIDGGLIYTAGVGFVLMPPLPDTLFPPSAKRHGPAVWYAGGKVYVFSGSPVSDYDASPGFAAYDVASSTWTYPTTTNVLKPRNKPSVVWTGREAIIWGGAEEDTFSPYYNDGGMFRP